MIPKPVVLYMDKNLIDASGEGDAGASCGKCMMYLSDTSECSILDPSEVDGDIGVCGLFVGGPSTTSKEHGPMKLVPAKVAGYTERGPTMCGNCRNFLRPRRCRVVEGEVEAGGCCNGWSAA